MTTYAAAKRVSDIDYATYIACIRTRVFAYGVFERDRYTDGGGVLSLLCLSDGCWRSKATRHVETLDATRERKPRVIPADEGYCEEASKRQRRERRVYGTHARARYESVGGFNQSRPINRRRVGGTDFLCLRVSAVRIR